MADDDDIRYMNSLIPQRDPNLEYGSILPFAVDRTTDETYFAYPEFVRDLVSVFEIPARVARGEIQDMNELQRAAADVALNYTPAGGLAGIATGTRGLAMGAAKLNDPPMYQSTVRDALDRISQEKGTGQQMRAMLEKAGAKPREIEESGLSSLLKNPKVTKSEIAEAIPQNISEDIYQDTRFVELDEQIERLKYNLEMDGLESDPYVIDEIAQGTRLSSVEDLTPRQLQLAELQKEFDTYDYTEQMLRPNDTKPSVYRQPQYTLEGGNKYREIVIKADPQEPITLPPTFKEVLPRIMNYSQDDLNDALNYTSGHFPETTNNLAHIRMDNRTTAGGKNTVFVQEIQSDLHQQGRKYGYLTSDKIAKTLDEIESQSQTLKDLEKTYDEALLRGLDNPTDKNVTEVKALENSIRLTKTNIAKNFSAIGGQYGGTEALPDLPLKKNWYETAFRRALKDAIDSGADSLTWTPGEVHMKRYPGEAKRDAGLQKFYDQTLVKYANKLGKKYGTKVEKDKLEIDEAMLSELEQITLWEDMVGMAPEDLAAITEGLRAKTQEVWSLPITAEMMKDLGGKPVSTYKRGGSVVERSNKHEPKAI